MGLLKDFGRVITGGDGAIWRREGYLMSVRMPSVGKGRRSVSPDRNADCVVPIAGGDGYSAVAAIGGANA